MEQAQQRQRVPPSEARIDSRQNGERLLTTKLYLPPPRPNAVLRPRLTEQLERGLNLGCKLILVSASAGFGKTALVSEWLRLRAGERVSSDPIPELVEGPPLCVSAWLSLDEADNDPTRFFTYLVAALQQLDKAIGQGVRLTPQLPPVESLVTVLVNDLALLSGPIVLVLDDYHLIHTPLIHDTLELLLSHQPPHLHLVITTREDPPLPLSRLRVRGHLVEIRQDELRFTADEVSVFMQQTMGLPLQPEAMAALEARTEGWVAGLQLAAISMQGRDERSLAEFIEAFSGSHRYVIDYLVEEVIQQQPDDIRCFLRETAILKRLSGPLCDAVLENGRMGEWENSEALNIEPFAHSPFADSQAILEYLEHTNLFLIPLDDERRWYRYHHLFAEFLRTELDATQQARLHRRAARWFEANGLLSEAIQHVLAAGDVAEAGRLIALAAPNALRHGELATLNGWLQALPDEVVQANYELIIFKAWLLWLTGQGALAESTIHTASAVMPKDAPRRVRGRLVSLLALLALGHQGGEGLQLAQEALSLIDENDVFFRSLTLLVIGEVRSYAGDSVGAAQVFEEIFQLGQKLDDPFLMIGAAMNLAQQWNWQGKRRQAVAMCQQIIDEWRDTDGRPFPLIGLVYYTLAEMEYYAHNLDLAQQYLERGHDLARRHAFMGFTLTGKMTAAPLQNALGEPDKALATIRELTQFIVQSNFEAYLPIFQALEALFQMRLGNLAAAERWAAEAALSAEDRPTPIRGLEYLVYVRFLLKKKRYAEAQTLLIKLAHLARSRERHFFLIDAYVLQALAHAALGEEAEALAVLSEALTLAAPEGYRRHFLDEGPVIATLLPKVRPIAPEFVDSLLEAFAKTATTSTATSSINPSADVQPLIEPLSDRELELLTLIAQGRSNREIAEALVITVGTVKKHLNNIFGKLDVKNRTQAVARAREVGLL